MKIYIDYRIGLWIGLFTLNILSSCVHTAQKLYGRNSLPCSVINPVMNPVINLGKTPLPLQDDQPTYVNIDLVDQPSSSFTNRVLYTIPERDSENNSKFYFYNHGSLPDNGVQTTDTGSKLSIKKFGRRCCSIAKSACLISIVGGIIIYSITFLGSLNQSTSFSMV